MTGPNPRVLTVLLRLVLLLSFCITLAGSPVRVAHGQAIDFSVSGLKAAPGYVMFVYPLGPSLDEGPRSQLRVVYEGERILVRLSAAPVLYLMKTAIFRSWRAAHPVLRQVDEDAATERLVHSKQVIRCDAQFFQPTKGDLHFELVKGNAAVCRIRQLGRGQPKSRHRLADF